MEPRSPTGLYHYAVGTLRLTFTKTRYSVVKKDSEPLQMITAEFSPLMKQFHIFFFWEEVPTDLGNRTSNGIGLASIWIGGRAPAGFGFGSSDLNAGVAWTEAYGAPGAPQLIPHWEGGWALYSRCAVNSQLGE